MLKFDDQIPRFEEQLGECFRPAAPGKWLSLRRLGLAGPALEFYRHHAPIDPIESLQSITLYTIEQIIEEHAEGAPGSWIQPHKYLIFASNTAGDFYALDMNHADPSGDPEVVIISRAIVNSQVTKETLETLAKPVAINLADFLDQLLRGEVDEECLLE